MSKERCEKDVDHFDGGSFFGSMFLTSFIWIIVIGCMDSCSAADIKEAKADARTANGILSDIRTLMIVAPEGDLKTATLLLLDKKDQETR